MTFWRSRRGAFVASTGAQIASSASNMLLTFGLALRVDQATFGNLMFAYLSVTISRGIASALFIEPNLIEINSSDSEARSASSHSAILAFGLISAAIVAFGGNFATDRSYWLLFACSLLPVLSQDLGRSLLISGPRAGLAAGAESIWLVAAMVGVLFTDTAIGLLASWVIGAWIASCLTWSFGFTNRLASPGVWLTRLSIRGRRFVLEYGAQRGTSQIVIWTLRSLVSAASFGALRGAQALFGPVNALTLGGTPIALTQARDSVDKRSGPLKTGVVFAALLVVLSSAPLIVIPLPGLGRAVLGASFEGASELVVPLVVQRAGTAAIAGALVVLRVRRGDEESRRARLASSAFTLVCGLGGAIGFGITGGAWGLATAGIAGAVVWWASVRGLYQREAEAS